jgi:hypothetical protein
LVPRYSPEPPHKVRLLTKVCITGHVDMFHHNAMHRRTFIAERTCWVSSWRLGKALRGIRPI